MRPWALSVRCALGSPASNRSLPGRKASLSTPGGTRTPNLLIRSQNQTLENALAMRPLTPKCVTQWDCYGMRPRFSRPPKGPSDVPFCESTKNETKKFPPIRDLIRHYNFASPDCDQLRLQILMLCRPEHDALLFVGTSTGQHRGCGKDRHCHHTAQTPDRKRCIRCATLEAVTPQNVRLNYLGYLKQQSMIGSAQTSTFLTTSVAGRWPGRIAISCICGYWRGYVQKGCRAH